MALDQTYKNRTFADHVDEHGLLTTRNWNTNAGILKFEGGDTAHREGMYILGLHLTGQSQDMQGRSLFQRMKMVIEKLRHPQKKGIWRRHPDESRWYGFWDRMSRDQLIPTVCALSVTGFDNYIDELFLSLFKRFSTTNYWRHNGTYPPDHPRYDAEWEKSSGHKWTDKKPFGDICGPSFWALFWRHKINKRGWRYWWSYPLILLGDIETLVNSVIKIHKSKSAGFSEDNNHIIQLIFGQHFAPTFVLTWARRLYFKKRRYAEDPVVKEYEVYNAPQSALRHYFDPLKWNTLASPPLDKLYEPLVKGLGE